MCGSQMIPLHSYSFSMFAIQMKLHLVNTLFRHLRLIFVYFIYTYVSLYVFLFTSKVVIILIRLWTFIRNRVRSNLISHNKQMKCAIWFHRTRKCGVRWMNLRSVSTELAYESTNLAHKFYENRYELIFGCDIYWCCWADVTSNLSITSNCKEVYSLKQENESHLYKQVVSQCLFPKGQTNTFLLHPMKSSDQNNVFFLFLIKVFTFIARHIPLSSIFSLFAVFFSLFLSNSTFFPTRFRHFFVRWSFYVIPKLFLRHYLLWKSTTFSL